MYIDNEMIDGVVDFAELCRELNRIDKLIDNEKPIGVPFVELLTSLTIDEINELVIFIKYGLNDIPWEDAVKAVKEMYCIKYYFYNLKDYALAAKRIKNGVEKRGACGKIVTQEKIDSFIFLAERAQTYMQLCYEYECLEDIWFDDQLVYDKLSDDEKDQLVTLMYNSNKNFDWHTLLYSKARVFQ